MSVYYNEFGELVSDWVPPQVLSYAGEPDDTPKNAIRLGDRIVGMALGGWKNKEIADQLGVSREMVARTLNRRGVASKAVNYMPIYGYKKSKKFANEEE